MLNCMQMYIHDYETSRSLQEVQLCLSQANMLIGLLDEYNKPPVGSLSAGGGGGVALRLDTL